MDVFSPDKLGPSELVGIFEQGSREWHQVRESGIGGSEIGAILGLNPWSSAYKVWAEKTKQLPQLELDNWAVRFGRAFEQPILNLWQEDNPDWIVCTTGTYRHREHTFAIANPDAIALHRYSGEAMILEVKTARNYWAEVPPHYEAQLQWYMAITGITKGRIVAVAGWDWRDIEYELDEFQAGVMFSAAGRLWEKVQTINEPDWDGSKATYEVIRELNPYIDDSEAELGELGVNLVAKQRAFDQAEAELNQFKSAVLSAMGKSKYGVVELDGHPKQTVAIRKTRGQGVPWLEVKR